MIGGAAAALARRRGWPYLNVTLGAAALGAAILLVALGLWLRYGAAVFFEMIASGISACF